MDNLPLKNTRLAALPGEKWKHIPGFGKKYLLSNYGRTKSVVRAPGILKSHFTFKRSAANKRQAVAVQVELSDDGHRRMIGIGRFVYSLFVKSFDISDRSVVITHKDGNKLNCHYTNLEKISLSDHAKQYIIRVKRKNNFTRAAKQVCQYDLRGYFISEFNSAVEAGKLLGIPRHYINRSAWNKGTTCGFYWRYGKPKKRISVSAIK